MNGRLFTKEYKALTELGLILARKLYYAKNEEQRAKLRKELEAVRAKKAELRAKRG